MMLIDANLLVYAYDAGSPHHARARAWLEQAFSSGEPVRLAWSTIHAFLRLTTNTAIFKRPLRIDEAISIVEEWLAVPSIDVVEPGPSYRQLFREVLRGGQVKGPLVMDAHLAALALESGATLCTTDRDFARFEGLKTLDPL